MAEHECTCTNCGGRDHCKIKFEPSRKCCCFWKPELKPIWIPVEDALPENRCCVIFTVDRWHPFVCVGYRINSEREGLKLQRWFDKLSGLNFSDYDVKAWMPMPDAYEPPKGEQK